MMIHSITLFIRFAEQCKPLALYSGATIVLLSGAHAVRVLTQARSAGPTS